jgi:NADH-quinone oxidoreductase subunit A
MLAEQYLPVLFVVAVALAVPLMFTLMGVLLGPKRDSAIKRMPFESGHPSRGTQHHRYSVRFYMVALAFLIFDVEIVFFYPWAVNFREFGFYGFWVMAIFFAVLILGLVYDWRKGALEWE